MEKMEEQKQESEKKSHYINADDLISKANKQKSLPERIWFLLTCWRPITKYEMRKNNEAWLKVGVAAINNYRDIQMIIINLNNIIVALRDAGLVKSEDIKNQEQGQSKNEEEQNSKKNKDVMYG
jgi:hypothetical protein